MASLLLLLAPALASAQTAGVRFQESPGRLRILIGDRPMATYVYRDERIARPYFAHVRAPGGVQVTRNHPPVPGRDAVDHDTFHPGIWLAFGDISRNDYWRLKAPVVHQRFAERPTGGSRSGSFAVVNRYLSTGGDKVVCTETCRYSILTGAHGYLLISDSQFESGEEFYFGDQEEMGLGVRVATPIAVRGGGGRILDSRGRRNERQVWGEQAEWCDYAGPVDGGYAGIMVMASPENFRPCWWHVRDYGFFTANPFGRNALTGGEKSRIVVPPGETFRLRFGVLLHSGAGESSLDHAAAYREFLGR